MTPNMHHMQFAGQAIFTRGLIALSGDLAQNAPMTERDEIRSLAPEVRAMRLEAQKKLLQHIPAWAEKKGVKQKHIANILKVSESVVSRYFSGDTIMPAGALEQIAVLLKVDRGALLSPPPGPPLGPLMEETISEMERIGPDQWAKVLEVAKGMRGPDKQ